MSGAPPDGPDLGRIGFVVAVVAVALAVVQQIVSVFLPRIIADLPVVSYSLYFGITGVAHAVICAVALVLGIVGAQRRRSPVLSGIAIGVGGAGVIAGIIGLVVIPFTGFVL